MATRNFPPYQRRQKQAAEQAAQTVDKGHGRTEVRRLISTTALNHYLDWPDVGQVFELERVRTCGTKTTVEVVYGITSLDRGRADAPGLLGYARGHWGIENGLHYVRDETLGEDRCRARTGATPQALAALRNVAVYLLKKVGASSAAAATRRVAAHPGEGLTLLFSSDP